MSVCSAECSGGARIENPGGASSRAALGFSSSADKNAQRIYDESCMQRSRLILFNFLVFSH